eukprot:CAMPEP_0115009752 /NCGR_PEP_ID=MMETSP0216-20121206/22843_1 /TAXON_ID=223996 /ORGANISM="Protocruzia adherens, Strain Boccale" /LENGTH=177 /DNA_ID=CAMNT_0002377707 /DNA_START=223 /DNA_END=756 /DNA_ORIENTATION=+
MTSKKIEVIPSLSENVDLDEVIDPQILRRDFMEVVPDHEFNQLYKCKICSKYMLREYSLRVHLLQHLNIKRFQCDRCQKKFSSRQYLSDHMNTHTGNKPYKCSYEGCDAAFKQRAKLSKHRREFHKDLTNRSKRREIPQNTLTSSSVPVQSLLPDMIRDNPLPEFVQNGILVMPKNY